MCRSPAKKKGERQRSEASALMSHAAAQTRARTHTQTTSWTQLQVSNGAGISFRLAAWINNGKRDLWDAHKNTLALPPFLPPCLLLLYSPSFPLRVSFPFSPCGQGHILGCCSKLSRISCMILPLFICLKRRVEGARGEIIYFHFLSVGFGWAGEEGGGGFGRKKCWNINKIFIAGEWVT